MAIAVTTRRLSSVAAPTTFAPWPEGPPEPGPNPPLPPLPPLSHRRRFWRTFNRACVRPFDLLSSAAMAAYLRCRGFRRRHVHTPLARVHVYACKGTGALPPLVLVHGIGGRPTDYFRMLTALKGSYQEVLMPELPGHGFSRLYRRGTKVDRQAFVRCLEATLNAVIRPENPAVLFAHSLGGVFGAHYTLKHPERVRGLVLASPTGAPFGAKLPAYRWLYSMRRLRDAREVAFKGFNRAQLFLPHFVWARLSAPLSQRMVMSDMFTHPLKPHALAALPVPVMLLWGADDHLLPPEQFTYFARYLPPGTRIERPCGVGHNNPALGPVEVREPLERFAAQLAAHRVRRPRCLGSPPRIRHS
ncbi:MAG TPA: alpha/beta fold hydrolase [Myxococcota bacterium]|nr:alpha/beta fold hydrolase [Myxococcota bacterium]